MAIIALSGWSTTAALNVDLNSIPLDGAVMTASEIDDAFRELMAQIATARTDAAAFRANTTGKLVDTDGAWGAAAEVTLTDASTIAVDMSTFLNAKVTLGGNRTLGQPSNTKVGQSGFIRIIQDGTGSRTLAYHADWKFAYGSDPVLTTTASATDMLFYHVIATNFIFASLAKAVA
jgi:hypothetical protein